ncbi:MAG: DUF1571 domain-containing protein [Planctomycetes bacterium]|nr:DUF1571 domain-containing protein [Planctomycetota bacterium]
MTLLGWMANRRTACVGTLSLVLAGATAAVAQQYLPPQQPTNTQPTQWGPATAQPRTDARRGIPAAAAPRAGVPVAQPNYAVQPIGAFDPNNQGRQVQPVEHQEPVRTASTNGVVPGVSAAPAPATTGLAAAPGTLATPATGEAAQGDLAARLQPLPGEHPLANAMRWASQQAIEINKIQDYTATLVKRERIDGTLNDHEYMFVKVRNRPFSVYLYFLGPAKLKGQECLYIAGQNDGKLWAHANGMRHKLIGTVSLLPTGSFAMAGQRYPITDLGILKLTTRLLEVGEQDMKFAECEVKTIAGAKINNRDCTCLQVTHPTPRKEFLYHIARVYIDNELNLPVRHEAYEWPKAPGEQPPLCEEYTYLNLKLNNGFTDADFSIENPNYQFK